MIDTVMTQSNNYAIEMLDHISSVMLITLLIIEIVGLTLVLIVFPVYYIVQSKREAMLKLMGTF